MTNLHEKNNEGDDAMTLAVQVRPPSFYVFIAERVCWRAEWARDGCEPAAQSRTQVRLGTYLELEICWDAVSVRGCELVALHGGNWWSFSLLTHSIACLPASIKSRETSSSCWLLRAIRLSCAVCCSNRAALQLTVSNNSLACRISACASCECIRMPLSTVFCATVPSL